MSAASHAFLAATWANMRQVRAAVLALHKAGKPIEEIVRCIVRGQRAEVFCRRESPLEA